MHNDIVQWSFLIILLKVIWIDVLLSGDNALVIAMACRGLPPDQRKFGILFGGLSAIVLRIILTGFIAMVLSVPYLKLVGGLLLLFIAVKLLIPQDEDDADVHQASSLLSAIGVIVVADATMSLDNIVAIAAASNGNLVLMSIGLLLSISFIMAGAQLIVMILDRYPVLIWAGAALLGWIAGDMLASEAIVQRFLYTEALPATIAFGVVIFGFVFLKSPLAFSGETDE